MGAVGKSGLELSLALLFVDEFEARDGVYAVDSQGGSTNSVSTSQICPSGNQQLPNLDSVSPSSVMEWGPVMYTS
jgi:hypothetical protein